MYVVLGVITFLTWSVGGFRLIKNWIKNICTCKRGGESSKARISVETSNKKETTPPREKTRRKYNSKPFSKLITTLLEWEERGFAPI